MPDKKSEEYELKRMGATPTKNSGRGHFQKGDGIIELPTGDSATVDVKEYKESFGLSKKMVAKLGKDAATNATRHGLFWVVLGDTEPRQRMVVMTETLFQELMDEEG